jgi:DNA-binding NarL/FixJ family response regulator
MIRVIIGDDFPAIAQGMRRLLEKASDIAVVGNTANFPSLLQLIQLLKPDVVIVNDFLPPLRFPDSLRQLQALALPFCVLVVSMHPDLAMGKEAVQNGACGFLHKEKVFEELVVAVRAVNAGQIYLSPSLH